MAGEFQVSGTSKTARFTLKLHRGDGMTLVAMNWKKGRPPNDFVGFAIEYKEPGGDRFYALKNRLNFLKPDGSVDKVSKPTLLSPIQKFRWVHFPRNAEMSGEFLYRVTPAFMNAAGELSYGDAQEAAIELRRDTYPGQLNVTFTRGFVSSQAFVDTYESKGAIPTLLPEKADDGLTFVPTHPLADKALTWMGFEARSAILELLDDAIADKKAQVRVVAYDLNEPEVVSRLEKIGARLKIIIDNEGAHGKPGSGESQAQQRLALSAGAANVKRQHMGQLQHNKTIVVDGPKMQAVVCGSTNFSWRGFYVQANNAVVMRGKTVVQTFAAAFDQYWASDSAAAFGGTPPAGWIDLKLKGIRAKVSFSPHAPANALLDTIAADVSAGTTSNLFYSLAFLYQTEGALRDAIKNAMQDPKLFVYGISDRKVGGLDVQLPEGRVEPMRPAALTKNAPEPFKSEPVGGGGTRMHHKFVVIDFDKPGARVYFGSYNFSPTADDSNGENLLLVRDRRIATSYMIEALRLFDHYHFRVIEADSKKTGGKLHLRRPPQAGELPWWDEDWKDLRKIRDRELFS
jgi:phosphatidylserine/phosphatidylglycerophosphate/cardiolipin synthase-like enzyme